MSTAANIKARLAPKKNYCPILIAFCPLSRQLPIAHDPLSIAIAQAAGEENLGEQSFTGKSQSLASFRGIAFAFLLEKLVICEGK